MIPHGFAGGLILWRGVGGLSLVALLALAGCGTSPSAALLADADARATATVLGCFPYGSYQHVPDSPTVTPTGTYIAPTATPAPTRPPQTPCPNPPCPYAQPTQTPAPAWPPPAITCTPDPRAATPVPAATAAFWPDRRPQAPAPAVMGNGLPQVVGAGLGNARPGSLSRDPRTGRPWISYSLLDPDPGQETGGRVYVRTVDPASGAWRDAVSVQAPGYYRIRNGPPESAVAVGADGRAHVIYARRSGPDSLAAVDYRVSTDEGATWSAPQPFAGADSPTADSLRLAVDARNRAHVAFTTAGDGSGPGLIHYFEELDGGSWRAEIPPVPNSAGRQGSVDLAFVTLPDGTIRTVLAWTQGPPDPPGGAGSVFVSSKDGPDGAWRLPTRLIDGSARPYGIGDYNPQGLRLLSFTDAAGTAWVYAWWAIYSTGRIAFAWSRDGGLTWEPTTPEGWHEDAILYYNRLGRPTPEPDERSRGTAHDPAPFWDPAQQKLFTLYTYLDRRAGADGGQGDSFPAYAWGTPGAPGPSWHGYATFNTIPQRLFASTVTAGAQQLRVTPAPGAGGYILAGWLEHARTTDDRFYLALVNPASLLAAGNVLP